jgi:hypothetical protein
MIALEDHDIQIADGTPVEPSEHCYFSQIQSHTNYALGRAAILPYNDVSFCGKMALAALKSFEMYLDCVVFDMTFRSSHISNQNIT